MALPDFYDSFTEFFLEDYDKYFYDYNTNILYDTTNVKILSYDQDFFNAVKIDNGFDIVVEFYNGGCSLDEALEIALKKI